MSLRTICLVCGETMSVNPNAHPTADEVITHSVHPSGDCFDAYDEWGKLDISLTLDEWLAIRNYRRKPMSTKTLCLVCKKQIGDLPDVDTPEELISHGLHHGECVELYEEWGDQHSGVPLDKWLETRQNRRPW